MEKENESRIYDKSIDQAFNWEILIRAITTAHELY